MPLYEYQCSACCLIFERFIHRRTDEVLCKSCGGPVEKLVSNPSVIPDDVPGGFVIENLDRHPRTFYTKSSYRDELKARGLTNQGFHHVGDPGEGSDKARKVYDRNKDKMVTRSTRWT